VFQVAFSFSQLQQKREFADYDVAVTISHRQARVAVEQAEEAFRNWEQVRTEQISHDYLYSLVIRERTSTKSPEWANLLRREVSESATRGSRADDGVDPTAERNYIRPRRAN
jgi:hypothetical protein